MAFSCKSSEYSEKFQWLSESVQQPAGYLLICEPQAQADAGNPSDSAEAAKSADIYFRLPPDSFSDEDQMPV